MPVHATTSSLEKRETRDMESHTGQDYAHHRRYVPLYHFVTAALLLINLIYAVVRLIGGLSIERGIAALTAVALIFVYLYCRAFATGVQDRVIRLEERLRLERLLPHDMHARIPELTVAQLVALRFASDSEVASLAQKVLDEGIGNAEEIKKLIREWRPDYCRI
jgi:hypothetical protein